MLAQVAQAAADNGSLGTGPALFGFVIFGFVAAFLILRLAGAPWSISIMLGVTGGSVCGLVASVGKHPLPVQAAVFGVMGLAAFIATIWLIIKDR